REGLRAVTPPGHAPRQRDGRPHPCCTLQACRIKTNCATLCDSVGDEEVAVVVEDLSLLDGLVEAWLGTSGWHEPVRCQEFTERLCQGRVDRKDEHYEHDEETCTHTGMLSHLLFPSMQASAGQCGHHRR